MTTAWNSRHEVVKAATLWDSGSSSVNAFGEPLNAAGPCACCGDPEGEIYHFKKGFRCTPCVFRVDCPIGRCDQP